ncbi:hypothetical protein F3Y22_tig00110429pilonHSYRG01214 [Hibiscus syriacus]|uniref:R13L1/DRL21-like LRR repeat region domain-containing protein n=1 Tax=Hibiscus syriacus TaxID=106335 RepID=A0A6A3ALE3_HIBSY|nr:hypothetical protein F3Y22_tig00110429pilonHSYRG01214 [Hibiscus syriacus]
MVGDLSVLQCPDLLRQSLDQASSEVRHSRGFSEHFHRSDWVMEAPNAGLRFNQEGMGKYMGLLGGGSFTWACFRCETIVEKILESASNSKFLNLGMDSLQTHIRRRIDGSKIIVTMCAQVVASITCTNPPYMLEGLRDDMSWSLLEKVAFKEGQEPNDSRLVAIGKDIVKRCTGNPLAIRTIGGVLYTKGVQCLHELVDEYFMDLLQRQPVHRVILDKVDHDTIILSLRRLRALDLHNTSLRILSSSISKLKHLRYLDLSKNEVIKKLPSSITELLNFQTLKFYSLKRLKELLRKLRDMISTRHLETGTVSVEKRNGGIKELKDLNELREELMITKMANLRNVASESKEANLKGKQHLEVLTLDWSQEITKHISSEEDEALLEGNQPHLNLKEFHIYGYRVQRLPNWMSFNLSLLLPNLLEITIWNCTKCLHLPLFSHLPKLKVLRLEVINAIEYVEDSSVKSSSSLSFKGNSLKEGTKCKDFFTCLEELDLHQPDAYAIASFSGRTGAKECACQAFTMFGNGSSRSEFGASFISFHAEGYAHRWYRRFGFISREGVLLSLVSSAFIHTKLSSSSMPNQGKHGEFNISLCQELDLATDVENNIMELQGLLRLCMLKIGDMSKLNSLSGGLQHVTTLTYLHISNCSNLKALPEWIDKLTSLQRFEILDCPQLASFPQALCSLEALKY